MHNDTSYRSPFVFNEDDTNLQEALTDGYTVKPPGENEVRVEYCAISIEQVLVMLAIEAAPSRWLFRRARQKAFVKAMETADLLIRGYACPQNPSSECELAGYRKYLLRLLRLEGS